MICPNCGEEMKPIGRRYVGFGDEPDYDLYEHIDDECRKCRIKCEFIGKYFDKAKNTEDFKHDVCEFDYVEYGYAEEFY